MVSKESADATGFKWLISNSEPELLTDWTARANKTVSSNYVTQLHQELKMVVLFEKHIYGAVLLPAPAKNTTPSLEKVESLCKLLIKTECNHLQISNNSDFIRKSLWLKLEIDKSDPTSCLAFFLGLQVQYAQKWTLLCLLPLQRELRKVNGLISCNRLISRSLLVSVQFTIITIVYCSDLSIELLCSDHLSAIN